jgi:hypothetical protein
MGNETESFPTISEGHPDKNGGTARRREGGYRKEEGRESRPWNVCQPSKAQTAGSGSLLFGK